MELEKAYFNKSFAENTTFWSRFPVTPSFEGNSILDVGCGHGALCIHMALKGAKKVIGIDINEQLIIFANDNLHKNFPELKSIVDFKVGEINTLPYYKFDLVISKSAFEHIIDPAMCLKEMKIRLKPGGRAYIGFGPLYNSPFGDHGITKLIFGRRVPWGHVVLPEAILIKILNKKYCERNIKCITDLGLNKLPLAQFKKIFYESGMDLVYFKVNQSKKFISKLFSVAQQLPFIEEYFSHNLYCILEKR